MRVTLSGPKPDSSETLWQNLIRRLEALSLEPSKVNEETKWMASSEASETRWLSSSSFDYKTTTSPTTTESTAESTSFERTSHPDLEPEEDDLVVLPSSSLIEYDEISEERTANQNFNTKHCNIRTSLPSFLSSIQQPKRKLGAVTKQPDVHSLVASSWGMRNKDYWFVDDDGVITSEDFMQEPSNGSLLQFCKGVVVIISLVLLTLGLTFSVVDFCTVELQGLPCTLWTIAREFLLARSLPFVDVLFSYIEQLREALA